MERERERERLYVHQVAIEMKIMLTKEGETFINGTVTRNRFTIY